jgi:VPS28 protein
MCTQSIPNFIGIDRFMTDLNLDHCQSAKIRIKAGKSNYSGEDTQRNLAQRVFDIITKFITPIDVLELGMTSIDEVAPPIRDVY